MMMSFPVPEASEQVSYVSREKRESGVASLPAFLGSSGATGLEISRQTGMHVGNEMGTTAFAPRFDWTEELNSEFIDLEQRCLAGKVTKAEKEQYQAMRRSRSEIIFADRYLHDYAEAKRIAMLTQKLRELQAYLKPIDTR